jgi:hypothetical protein
VNGPAESLNEEEGFVDGEDLIHSATALLCFVLSRAGDLGGGSGSGRAFHRCKKQDAGLGVGEARCLKPLVADLSPDKLMLQDVLSKRHKGLAGAVNWFGISRAAMG